MIPITFNKDDLNNVKKGNVRGQDLASFLSISMPKRAGVLDIFDDPCGYVQITPTTGYATVTMKKGYINIYGRCIYVEQGEQVQIALPTSGTVSGTFGIRINLGESGANEVTWFTKTTTLQQDNLLNNEITGVYEFALYNYTATTSDLTLTKIASVIENIDDYLKGANFETQPITDNSTKLATTAFAQALFSQTQSQVNKAQNGTLKLPNGLIIKWGFGRTPSSSSTSISVNVLFDTQNPFTTLYSVVVSPYNDSTGSGQYGHTNYSGTRSDLFSFIVTNKSTEGFTYFTRTDRTDCFYIAIGV